jgi:hypothetical protein
MKLAVLQSFDLNSTKKAGHPIKECPAYYQSLYQSF